MGRRHSQTNYLPIAFLRIKARQKPSLKAIIVCNQPTTNERCPPRPLMLAYWGRYGALPKFTLELAEACFAMGYGSQTTFSISTSSELFPKFDKLGDALFAIDTYTKLRSALNLINIQRLRRSLRKRLLADGTRAFVTLMPHVWSPLVAPVLRRLGVRHTVIVHDAYPHLGDHSGLINKWLMQEARLADRVVTLSTSVARNLISSNTIPEDKISLLFHPDLTYAPILPGGDNGTKPLRMLFFGRILPYKGLSSFVKAAEILKQAGLPIEVGVFGDGTLGPERARLERLGAEIVNKWIPPADIGGILQRYDVVVLTHRSASQSGVIAAAHGAGLPVVVTPVGGLPEQVIPEVTGLIAADAGAAAIAAAVRRLAEDRDLHQRIHRKIIASKKARSMERFFHDLSKLAQ